MRIRRIKTKPISSKSIRLNHIKAERRATPVMTIKHGHNFLRISMITCTISTVIDHLSTHFAHKVTLNHIFLAFCRIDLELATFLSD